MVRAVLHVFRDHLTIEQALRLADILPAVLRAIFVEDWHPPQNPVPFPDQQQLIAEVRGNRRDHNLADERSIRDVAQALRRNIPLESLQCALKDLPAGARAYWLD